MEAISSGNKDIRDASWELILAPPTILEIGYYRSRFKLENLANVDISPLIDDLGLHDPSYEGATSSLILVLVNFFVFVAVRDGELLNSNNNPTAAWIRAHLQQLRSTTYAPAISLSPANTPFPLEALVAFRRCAPLKDPDGSLRSEVEKMLEMALEKENGAQAGNPRPSSPDPRYLCLQIIIRGLLCLVPAICLMPKISSTIWRAGLLATTLATMMNSSCDWSVEKVVKCAVGVLGVKEAPQLVAGIAIILVGYCQHSGPGSSMAVFGKMTPPPHEARPTLQALPLALLSVRYLAAGGAWEALGADEGMPHI